MSQIPELETLAIELKQCLTSELNALLEIPKLEVLFVAALTTDEDMVNSFVPYGCQYFAITT